MLNNKSAVWSVCIIVAVVAISAGYFLGKKTAEAPADVAEAASAEAGSSAAPAGQETSGAQGQQAPQQQKGMSASELAKLKDVPESLESPDGNFTLVTVIEGEEQNRFLRGSLQAVTGQRRNLAILSQRFNQMDPKLAQQRELLAGQINETRQALEQNLRFMAQNFGYTLANNYVLVPHQATLNSVIGTGEDQIKTVVYTFDSSESYEKFQQKTDAYAKMKREQVAAYRETLTEAEKQQPLPKMELTEPMEKARAEMIKDYKCDPERTYIIEIQKAALYFRPSQQR
ncbi:MAG: hypothetical protein ACPH5P_04695 [Akkermansiaceae bacterium]